MKTSNTVFKRKNGAYVNDEYQIYELSKNQWILEGKNSDGEYVYLDEYPTKTMCVDEIKFRNNWQGDKNVSN